MFPRLGINNENDSGSDSDNEGVSSPPSSSNRHKYNIFLDLDNTLINSLEPSEIDELKGTTKQKLKKFYSTNFDDVYVVYWRPGLQKFLDFLFQNFNVSAWTAGSKQYLSFIADHVILNPKRKKGKNVGRKLDFMLNDSHCDHSKKYLDCVKNLRFIWEDLKIPGYTRDNTYILDDLDEIHANDNEHVIHAKSFEVLKRGSLDDKFLENVTKRLKKLLKTGKINTDIKA